METRFIGCSKCFVCFHRITYPVEKGSQKKTLCMIINIIKGEGVLFRSKCRERQKKEKKKIPDLPKIGSIELVETRLIFFFWPKDNL